MPRSLRPGRPAVQLLGDLLVVVDRVGGVRGADQHQVGAQLLHHVELAVGPAQVVLRTASGRTESKSRNGWYRSMDRPRSAHRARTSRGGQRRDHEVRLEDLHAVEPGRRGGDQLVLEGAGDADRGDGRPDRRRV